MKTYISSGIVIVALATAVGCRSAGPALLPRTSVQSTPGVAATPGPTTSGVTLAALPSFFRDASGNSALAVQLLANRADSGRFDFYVDGEGQYTGTATVRQLSATADTLTGNGSGTFIPNSGAGPSAATFRIGGTINRAVKSATVSAWLNGSLHVLSTGGSNTADAAVVANQVIASLQSQNWATLYSLAFSDIQTQFTRDQFAQAMRSQTSSGPTLARVVLNGTAQVHVDQLGYSYYRQPILMTKQDSSGTEDVPATLTLILDNGKWRFYSTGSAGT